MPIKSLELYLFERGLVGTYPIEALKNTTLGIDVNHYVSRLLTSKKEQFLDAIGGFPTSLNLYLESDLKIFKEYKVTPVFIFDGSLTANQLDAAGYFTATANEVAASSTTSDLSRNSSASSQASKTNKELMLFQRHKAWTQWSNLMTSNQNSYIDQPLQPQEPFRYNTIMESKRYQANLIDYFIEHDITYQVAPFTSWSQLSYLLSKGYIDAIYGPTDCLMLKNVDKFILGMEFPNKDFRFIDRSRVLKEFHLNHEEFIDIAMAVGNDLQPYTLPPLQIYPNSKVFEIALEMVLNTGTNFYAYQFSNQLDNGADNSSSNYVEKYHKGIASLRYMPVMHDNGRVEVYLAEADSIEQSLESRKSSLSSNSVSSSRSNSDSPIEKKMESLSVASESTTTTSATIGDSAKNMAIPNDIHDVITQKLPAEYYFYRSLGLATGNLFDAITTGVYPEEPPLDGGSSNSYRELISKSVEAFKNKEINLLTQPINRYFQMKQINLVKWFSPNNKTGLTNRISPSIFDRLNHLVVKTDLNENEFSISEFITILNNSKDISKDFISEDAIFSNSLPLEKKLTNSFDLLSTSLLRSLVQLEFFEYNFSQRILKPTKWGEVLLKFNDLSIDSKFHERLLVLLVFLKLDTLKLSEEIKPVVRSALSDHTLRSYPQESTYILLLTRLLTLYQVEQKPSNYHGPIDKKTLIFREHLDYVRDNLKNLFEATIISSLTSNEFDRLSLDNNDWKTSIVHKMPFKLALPNTIMAMMIQFFLQKYLHNGNAKNDALTLVATEFSTYKTIPDLGEQFENAVEYLTQCVNLVKELSSQRLMKNDEAALIAKAVEFTKNAILNDKKEI
ncbi:hypothetical protein KAFR_0J01810 [Kazachstania africana CBS 2517]|uniref:XPG N-terminal domain-containing protein n=1 Tax=Kazachstania africana (strain ATCC 22294 / BCRC 22015 / CBS 2517 / CECT 1963 / NBRC 1671 / NRRL Y-8276) TaxID=1071382 RepID=H2B0U5_KAZAF|nr:hypothetical protein KAFR_0J01810 [Kazachstania africana CBS 2517]CCF60245.1 hypothetical protein KAFR_0J01810 [Kazachstania africana CBS 2517]